MWWRTTTTTSLKLKLIINLCIFPPAFHDALVVRPEWENGKFSKFQELPWCSLYDVLSTEEEQQQLPVVTFQVLENVNTARPAGPAVSTSATVTSQTAYSQRHTHVNFGHNHTNMKLSNALQSTHPPTFQPAKRQSIQNKFVGLLFSIRSAINNWIFKKTHSPATTRAYCTVYGMESCLNDREKFVWPFSCVDPDV